MIDRSKVVFVTPPSQSATKQSIFRQAARHTAGWIANVHELPDDAIPVCGQNEELRESIFKWIRTGRTWVYVDRGYFRRGKGSFSWLPKALDEGFRRFHVGCFQLQSLGNTDGRRLRVAGVAESPWQKPGKHIVVASQSLAYEHFHGLRDWTNETVRRLKRLTDRPVVVRPKNSTRPLAMDLRGAHALVTHGSNAAVEAVILGTPVFVDRISAAALVGKTDLAEIENPIRPDRHPWLCALANSQFSIDEMLDGSMWDRVE